MKYQGFINAQFSLYIKLHMSADQFPPKSVTVLSGIVLSSPVYANPSVTLTRKKERKTAVQEHAVDIYSGYTVTLSFTKVITSCEPSAESHSVLC